MIFAFRDVGWVAKSLLYSEFVCRVFSERYQSSDLRVARFDFRFLQLSSPAFLGVKLSLDSFYLNLNLCGPISTETILAPRA